MEGIAKHIIFEGRVQGVGFRFTTLDKASSHSLRGYVRNMPDGSVEMLAQGRPEDIDNCIDEIGSVFDGYITAIRVEEVPPRKDIEGFRITF